MSKSEHQSRWQSLTKLIVNARKRGDDHEAAKLSEKRNALKRYRFCVDCGVPLGNSGMANGKRTMRCTMHATIAHFYKHALL